MSEHVTIDGVDLVLAPPDDHQSEWIDFGYSLQRLEAAWLRLSPHEPPLNPRSSQSSHWRPVSFAVPALSLPLHSRQEAP